MGLTERLDGIASGKISLFNMINDWNQKHCQTCPLPLKKGNGYPLLEKTVLENRPLLNC